MGYVFNTKESNNEIHLIELCNFFLKEYIEERKNFSCDESWLEFTMKKVGGQEESIRELRFICEEINEQSNWFENRIDEVDSEAWLRERIYEIIKDGDKSAENDIYYVFDELIKFWSYVYYDKDSDNIDVEKELSIKLDKGERNCVNENIDAMQIRAEMTRGLSKSSMSQFQKNIFKENEIAEMDIYDFRILSANLSRNAMLVGSGGILISGGIQLFSDIIQRRNVELRTLLTNAFATGSNAGVRTAISGAIQVGIERGCIPALTKSTPAVVIVGLACMSMETGKLMMGYVSGKYTALEVLDHAGKAFSVVTYGVGFAYHGALIGATSLSIIPVVGTFLGSIMGGMIGNVIGNRIANIQYEKMKQLVNAAQFNIKIYTLPISKEGIKIRQTVIRNLRNKELLGNAIR